MTRRAISNPLEGGGTRGLKLIIAVGAVWLAGGVPAVGQQAQARRVAGYGDLEYPPGNPLDNLPVWETDIAAGTERVMVIYRVGWYHQDPKHVGYAFATQGPIGPLGRPQPIEPAWWWSQEDVVPFSNLVTHAHDPTVAHDPLTGNFVLTAIDEEDTDYVPTLAIWDAALEDFAELVPGEGQGWARLELADGSDVAKCDKPTIVAGEVIDDGQEQHQEFYICYFNPGGDAWYLRSTDGGYTWYGDRIEVDGERVYPSAYAYPAALGTSPLYVGYHGGDWGGFLQAFGFVEGADPEEVGEGMDWSYLDTDNDPNNGTLRVGLYAGTGVGKWIPAPGLAASAHIFPQMAVDPSDPDNVVYVVYHDTVDFPPSQPIVEYDIDVDVYLVKLTRDPQTDTWSAGDPKRVNDPDPDDPPPTTPSDQFFPNLTVTPGPSGTPADTRIHVIFFDDRRFPNQPDRLDFTAYPPDPEFDVYYAYSYDGGVTFEANERLFRIPDDENEPAAVEYSLVNPDHEFLLKDYIGIDAQVDGNGLRIWTSFPGTQEADPTEHKSVIWSSQITWALP